jgi:hypothetical protein
MTAPKRKIGPRKAVAAAVLRELANEKYLAVPNPTQVGADLRLIADCILGEARWGKAGKYPPDVQQRINFYAHMVESKRRPGQSPGAALTVWAKELTRSLGRSHEPNAEQELRDAIDWARKEGRKRLREK